MKKMILVFLACSLSSPLAYAQFNFWHNLVQNKCQVSRTSCLAHLNAGCASSGIFNIRNSGSTLKVYCDQQTDGGGWTLVSKMNAINLQNIQAGDYGNPISGYFKLSDNLINSLKSSTYKVTLATYAAVSDSTKLTKPIFFSANCVFNSTIPASGDCLKVKFNFTDASYAFLGEAAAWRYGLNATNVPGANGYWVDYNGNPNWSGQFSSPFPDQFLWVK